MSIEPIRASEEIGLPPQAAFARFTGQFSSWWPAEFSWSQEVLADIGMQPREGGMLYEIGPHGFRLDWGRIIEWDPPSRLVFLWQITAQREPQPNPEKASEVEVRFEPAGEGTRVSVEHRAWERHGDGAQEYRDGLAGAWEYVLRRFAGS